MKGFEEKRAIEFVFFEGCGDYYIREKLDVVDLKDWLDEKSSKFIKNIYFQYISPYIGNLACSLHAIFSKMLVSQKVDFGGFVGLQAKQADCFKISWNSESYQVYPIQKIEITARDDILNNFYALYSNGDLCDLKLITKEGVILNVHSLLMYSHGGEVLQKMLTLGMKESSQKVLEFKEFSVNTVTAFIDFIYLGEKGVSLESLKERDLDLSELFDMAHTYQVKSLVDHCTNLISCYWNIDHIEIIKDMADYYGNEHLKKLYEYFLQKIEGVFLAEDSNSSSEIKLENLNLELGFQF